MSHLIPSQLLADKMCNRLVRLYAMLYFVLLERITKKSQTTADYK